MTLTLDTKAGPTHSPLCCYFCYCYLIPSKNLAPKEVSILLHCCLCCYLCCCYCEGLSQERVCPKHFEGPVPTAGLSQAP